MLKKLDLGKCRPMYGLCRVGGFLKFEGRTSQVFCLNIKIYIDWECNITIDEHVKVESDGVCRKYFNTYCDPFDMESVVSFVKNYILEYYQDVKDIEYVPITAVDIWGTESPEKFYRCKFLFEPKVLIPTKLYVNETTQQYLRDATVSYQLPDVSFRDRLVLLLKICFTGFNCYEELIDNPQIQCEFTKDEYFAFDCLGDDDDVKELNFQISLLNAFRRNVEHMSIKAIMKTDETVSDLRKRIIDKVSKLS